MSFSAKSLDFLFENSLNDSKVWFGEHKEEYRKYIIQPFSEVVDGLRDVMLEIDDEIICDPKKISRIYRDARYSKGKSIFRDYVWYTFSRPRTERSPQLGFYFSISPNGFDYGCGFYSATAGIMDEYRRLITDNSKEFKDALTAYRAQNVFELYGELYKRNRYPEESKEKQDWLNRKNIGVSCESKDFDLLFGSGLIPKLAADFQAISPIYELFMTAYRKSI